MKPGFALLLSRDGIGLLQRSGDGWLAVDEVSLDDPDLAPKLETLRITAEVLAREAGAPEVLSKLILPNSEILYEEVILPKAGDTEIEIERHLDGRTPYHLADLTYDYILSDRLAQIAVVARETLAEAEAFATENGFNPVCFCALPPMGSFIGEPMFGLTKAARKLLPSGASIERDDGKLIVSGAVDLPELPVAEPPAVEPVVDMADAEPIPEFRSTRSRSSETNSNSPEIQPDAVPPRLALKASGSKFRASAATSQALSGAFADVRHLLSLKPVPTALAAGLALFAAVGWVVLSPSRTHDQSDGNTRATTGQIALQAPVVTDQTISELAGYRLRTASLPKPSYAELPTLGSAAELAAVLPTAPKQPSGLGPPLKRLPVRLPETNDVSVGDRPEAAVIADSPAVIHSGAQLTQVASVSPQRPSEPGLPPAAPSPVEPMAAEGLSPAQEVPTTNSGGDTPVPSAETAELASPAQTPVTPGGHTPVVAEIATIPNPLAEAGTTETLALLTQPDRDAGAGSGTPSLGLTNNLDTRPDASMPPVAPSDLLRDPEQAEVVLVPTLNSDQLAQLAQLRPNERPEGLSPPQVTDAVETDPVIARLQTLRPTARPSGLNPPKPVIQVAVNDAAKVPLAQRPKKRPSKISQMAAQRIPQKAPKANAQQTAAAAAIVAPKKKPNRRRETSTVARRATMQNALATKQVALIGVYGSDSKRRALVRLPSGRYVKVNVGDRIDGGKVASIGRNSIKYVKGGRSKTLKVPEG